MRRPGRKPELSEPECGDPNHSYDFAVTLLARRDYSSGEMTRKLEERGYLEHAVVPVVEELLASNKLNDERYSQNFVAYRARRGHGPSTIDEAVKGDEAPDFRARARTVRARKFGPDIPNDRKERARQARFLQYRGFSTDHIRAVLEGAPDDESELDPGGQPDPH
jgi:regulatory protein